MKTYAGWTTSLSAIAALMALLISPAIAASQQKPPTGVSAAGATAIDQSARALLPARIRNAGVIVFASDAVIPPFIFTEGNRYVGSTYEFETAIAAKLGLKLKILNTVFGNLITSLQSRRADASMGDFTDTPVRRRVVNMIDYEKTSHKVMVKSGNPKHIAGVADLCGMTVGSSTGGLDALLEEQQSAVCKKEGKSPLSIKLFANTDGADLAVESGQIDAIIEEDQPGAYLARMTGKVEQVGAPVGKSLHGIAVIKGDESLTKALHKAMQDVLEDGQYAKILAKWHASDTALTKITINKGNTPTLTSDWPNL